ncbi:hypothetical protein D3C83_25360 [compost metagenome]
MLRAAMARSPSSRFTSRNAVTSWEPMPSCMSCRMRARSTMIASCCSRAACSLSRTKRSTKKYWSTRYSGNAQAGSIRNGSGDIHPMSIPMICTWPLNHRTSLAAST